MNTAVAVPALRTRFTGFPPEAFRFLHQLELNNRRAWFDEHRQVFDTRLLRPALALVEDLTPVLQQRISAGLRGEPGIGGSVLRIQRDARYARGSPFKAHLDLWFWEGSGPSREHPGFFLRLSAERLALGAGVTQFPYHLLHSFRRAVDEPRTGRRLVALLHRLQTVGWQVGGPTLRRVPSPYTADHERARLLMRTGLRVERSDSLPGTVHRPELMELVVDAFCRLKPLHRWLVEL